MPAATPCGIIVGARDKDGAASWLGGKIKRRFAAADGGHFEVFVTIDSNLLYQQEVTNLPLALIALRAKSNKFEDVEPLVPEILRTLLSIRASQVVTIG